MKQFNLQEHIDNPNKKIVTRDGKNVRIICTDRKISNGDNIIGLAEDFDGIEKLLVCNNDGKEIYEQENYDLFFADEEEELTEFEKEVKDLMNTCCNEIGEASITDDWAKEHAAILFDLAKREIEKEYKLVDKNKDEWAEGWNSCHEDLIKDIPKLEKGDGDIDPMIPVIYTNAASMKTYIEYDGCKACVQDLFKRLPREKK